MTRYSPYESNVDRLGTGEVDRHARTAVMYRTGGVERSATSVRCAHSVDEASVQRSSLHGMSCLISRWERKRGMERIS
jgi:hypothetical protein